MADRPSLTRRLLPLGDPSPSAVGQRYLLLTILVGLLPCILSLAAGVRWDRPGLWIVLTLVTIVADRWLIVFYSEAMWTPAILMLTAIGIVNGPVPALLASIPAMLLNDWWLRGYRDKWAPFNAVAVAGAGGWAGLAAGASGFADGITVANLAVTTAGALAGGVVMGRLATCAIDEIPLRASLARDAERVALDSIPLDAAQAATGVLLAVVVVTEPWAALLFAPIVFALFGFARDQQRLRREIELARTDALAGVANRRYAEELLTQALGRFSRDNEHVALVLIDLDHFKEVNDGYGHASGDAVLVEAASRLAHAVRPGDVVARWGGEEFACILTGDRAATRVAEICLRLHAALRERPFHARGEELLVTGSIGAALSRPEETIEALFERADAALYRAKESGRDCIRIADADELVRGAAP